jgi:class 3 adenylate cyclase
MYSDMSDAIQPGMSFEAIIRKFAELGRVQDAVDRIEEWVDEQLTSHRKPGGPLEQRLGDGGWIQVSERKTDDGGTVTIVNDITERKLAEKALEDKEKQLRIALDNMPGGLAVNDSNATYTVVNNWIREFLSLPNGIMEPGTEVKKLLRYLAERGMYGPGEVEQIVQQHLDVLTKGRESTIAEIVTEEGFHLQVYRQPLSEGGNAAIFTDITELKRAEEALRVAKDEADESAKVVAEKNKMLESLSSKLSKYLAPQVYASIFAGHQSVEVASKRKKLSIFFSDIVGFTETTDNLESEELTNLLNDYLTEMSTIALDYGATIDKYIGDAILAFFGDPESKGVEEDAKNCVNMAIAMQRRLRELEQEWRGRGLERPFRVRMGISTGFCTVGNFGSRDRMDYTIIGNEVNLAARLEAKAEAGGILVSHETYALTDEIVMAEEQPPLTVKGFAAPVKCYKIVGIYENLVEEGKIIRNVQDGISLLVDLTKRDKASAIQALEDIVSQLKD